MGAQEQEGRKRPRRASERASEVGKEVLEARGLLPRKERRCVRARVRKRA